MTIPDARLVDERLANLLSHARHKVERNTGFSDALSKLELEFWTDQVAAYTELQQLRAANQQGREWVACSERLPERDGFYLVTGRTDEGEPFVWTSHFTANAGTRHKPYWSANEVQAWQELRFPPPFQGAK